MEKRVKITTLIVVIAAALLFASLAEAVNKQAPAPCEISFQETVKEVLSAYRGASFTRDMTREQTKIFWQRVLVFSHHRAPTNFSGVTLWKMTIAEGDMPDKISIYDEWNNPYSLVLAGRSRCLVFEALIITSTLEALMSVKPPPLPRHQNVAGL